MEIRKPEGEDKHSVLEILTQMSVEYMPEMEAEFDQVVSGNYIGFVAVNDLGEVTGYVSCIPVTKTYKLETMAVRGDMHRKGVGSLLVSYLVSYLRQNGLFEVLNVVTESGDYAEEFYKRCGFSVSGRVKDEYIPGIEQVHLTLRANSPF